MSCASARERDLAEQYVAGTLGVVECDAFEAHLFECDACAAHVGMLHEIRRELEPAPVSAAEARQTRYRLPLLAAAAMVVVGVWVGVRYSQPATRAQAARTAVPAQPAVPDAARAAREALLALATIEPPAYIALNLRGASEPDFDRGMAAYARGDYAAASTALARAVRRDPASPAANFYLGVSHLMTGDAKSGAASLREAAAGDSPYKPVSLLFLAKALIAAGDFDAAAKEADRAASLDSEYAAEARRLSAALYSARESR